MKEVINKKVIGIIGICLLIIGLFLPYYKYELFGYSYNLCLIKYIQGKILLFIILLNAGILYFDYILKFKKDFLNTKIGTYSKNLKNKMPYLPFVLLIIFLVWLLIDLKEASRYLDYGPGFYIVWLGVVFTGVETFIQLFINKKSVVNVPSQGISNMQSSGVNSDINTNPNMNNMNINNVMNNNTNMNLNNGFNNNSNTNLNNNVNTNQNMNNMNINNGMTNSNVGTNPINNTYQNVDANSSVNDVNPNMNNNSFVSNSVNQFKFCSQCGTKLNSSDTKCFVCGKELNY